MSAVGDENDVIVDCGIQRGTDVLKALSARAKTVGAKTMAAKAVGAKAVGGRSYALLPIGGCWPAEDETCSWLYAC